MTRAQARAPTGTLPAETKPIAQLGQVRESGSYRDIAYQVECLVMSCAALVHISTIVFVCSLKETICLLIKSV
jgi:hypothetical protein